MKYTYLFMVTLLLNAASMFDGFFNVMQSEEDLALFMASGSQ